MKRNLTIFSVAIALFAIVNTVTPIAQVYGALEFTYAEQKSKDKVTQLELRPEEQVDLCFLGAPEYNKYTCTWTSSDEAVATVDNKGNITAKAQGTAEIMFTQGGA